MLTDFGFEDYGLFLKINHEIKPPLHRIVLLQGVLDFFEQKFSQREPYDHWENMLYHLLQYEYCNVSASQFLFRENGVIEDTQIQRLKSLCRGYYGTISLAELLLDQKNPDFQFIDNLLSDAENLKYQAVKIEDAIIVYHLSGRYYELKGEMEKAREMLQQSIKIWPNPDNRAYNLLSELNQH